MTTNVEIVAQIKSKVINKVVHDTLLEIYRDEAKHDFQIFMDTYLPDHNSNHEIDKVNAKVSERYQSNLKLTPLSTHALMVTFSPDPEHSQLSVPELKILAHKLCKPLSGITNTIYALEQRGSTEDEIGIGPHFHALLLLDKSNQNGEVTRVVKRIVSLLGKYRTKTDHFLDIKRVSAAKIEEKILYISGKKWDKEKQSKINMDEIWRQEHHLEPFYSNFNV